MVHILTHILPQEIDQLEQLLIQLKYSSRYLDKQDEILVDVVLNNNLTDWETSSFPKSFFLNKLTQLEKLTSTWAKTKFEANDDGSILGCVDHRRRAIRETQSKVLFTIDPDIITSQTLLYHIVNAVKLIKDPYYILTPQITPMWDDSWTILVNQNYIHEPPGDGFKYRDPYEYAACFEDVSIKPIDGFKFGGGLATVISVPLVKFIGLPESMGPYGLEDTYLMNCAYLMKQKGINVQQFILENEVVIEDHLFKFNPYKEYITSINRQEEFKKMAHENFSNEIIKFGNSL